MQNKFLFSLLGQISELKSQKTEVEGNLDAAYDKLANLVEDYNRVSEELSSLTAERDAVHELKAHVEQQHQALTDGANQSERSEFV